MKPATLVAAALCVASVAAFAPKASGAALMSARSQRVAPPAMSMEVWSEKNIRLTLPLGVALPLAGLVTPPDSFGASVLPVAADYTKPFDLPDLPEETSRIVVFFPGSTIGNFSLDETAAFLAHVAQQIGDDGALLVGMDQWKDADVLRLAYDDPEGVTADFNLNLLRRINAELDGDADLDAWAHAVRLDPDARRVEMHLRSLRDQTLTVLGHPFAFAAGETIHTENSHKYGPDGLGALAEAAGLVRQQRWTDARGWFAVELYAADGAGSR